ncbi:D-glycerate dehydrogenase [Solibacillus sp. FSL W8-0474]|uniref:2-hydroxyacid dehydrogenase n=1 Tax=Solibacillus sp. FSL W8-0474 TaxID=2975336 RepID=UPI0030FBD569
MKKLFISRKMPNQMVQQLIPYYDIIQWREESNPAPIKYIEEIIKDVDAVWCVGGDPFTNDTLSKANNLKLIANFGVGYNNLDIDSMKKFSILGSNTPEVLNDATADLAFTLMLSTARKIPQNVKYIKENYWTGWEPYQGVGVDISNKTLGIIGMGKIGQTVAKRSTGFDMNILYHNRRRNEEAERKYGATYCNLKTLLIQSDFIIVLTPLTDETRNLITLEQLKLMKPSAVLINVARGGIVNENDLYIALKEEIIWAAGSDVFEMEPIDNSHFLLEMENFVAIPHIGSATIDTRNAMMQLNINSLIAFAKNEPIPNLIYL